MTKKQELLVVKGRAKKIQLTSTGGFVAGALLALCLSGVGYFAAWSAKSREYDSQLDSITQSHKKALDVVLAQLRSEQEAHAETGKEFDRAKEALTAAQLNSYACNGSHPMIQLLLNEQKYLRNLLEKSRETKNVKIVPGALIAAQNGIDARLRDVNAVLAHHAKSVSSGSPVCTRLRDGQEAGPVLAYFGQATLYKHGWRFTDGAGSR